MQFGPVVLIPQHVAYLRSPHARDRANSQRMQGRKAEGRRWAEGGRAAVNKSMPALAAGASGRQLPFLHSCARASLVAVACA